MGEFLIIKDWEEYQHYKNRNPPWIKLHANMLNNRKFTSLAQASRGLLMQLWILGSEHEGKVPFDLEEIRFRLRDDSISMDDLILLINKGFFKNGKQLIADASTMQADDVPETETEERREETENQDLDTNPGLPSKNGKHYAAAVGKYLDKIDSHAIKILKLPQKNPPFNPYQFIQKYFNEGYHPEVIYLGIKAIHDYWDKMKTTPWQYIRKAMHQNQLKKESEGFKKMKLSDLHPDVQNSLSYIFEKIKEMPVIEGEEANKKKIREQARMLRSM